MFASSQIISFVLYNCYASPLCFDILHDDQSSKFNSNLNRDYAVQPPGKLDPAMPDVTVANAICHLDLNVMSKARYISMFFMFLLDHK